MAVHAGARHYSIGVQPNRTAGRNADVVIYGGTGAASDGTLPTGQTLDSTQEAIRLRSGASAPEDVIEVTVDGGTTWSNISKYATVEVADPGTGTAIPVTKSATIGITTAAAETNTLAIPTFIGQRLILYVDVYAVGDRVVTVAAAFNVADNNTLTFGAVSEMCELVAVKVAGSLVWQIVANDGVGLTTV